MKLMIITAATGLMLAGTACSSSTNGSGARAGAPANTTRASGSTAAAPSTGSAPSTSDAAAGGGQGDNGWCTTVASSGKAILDLSDPTSLPKDWQAKAEALAAAAPSEIRADVETVVRDDVKIVNGDASADSTPEFLKAGEHLVTWMQTHCPGVFASLNPGLGSSPTG